MAQSSSPSLDGTGDILVTPFIRLEESLDKKRRNLTKRFQRLQQLQEDKNAGKKLSTDQVEALSKIGEVELEIKRNEEIAKAVNEQKKEYEIEFEKKITREKEEAVKKEKAERKKEKEQAKKEQKETKKEQEPTPAAVPSTSSFDGRQLIRQILHQRELLEHLARPIVRKSFASGEYGAPKLSEAELSLLDDIHKLYNPTSEACRNHEEFEKRLNDSAEALNAILVSKDKNEDVERRRAILHTIASSTYFEQLKQNAATKKEKKEKLKREKKEEEEKKKEQQEEEPAPAPIEVESPRPKSPIVTFLEGPRNVVYVGLGHIEVESFGYDDSLPHPDHVVDTTPPIPPQQAPINTFINNGAEEKESASQPDSPPAAPKPSPSDSKEGSGAATPIEQRNQFNYGEAARRSAIANAAYNLANVNSSIPSQPPHSPYTLAHVYGSNTHGYGYAGIPPTTNQQQQQPSQFNHRQQYTQHGHHNQHVPSGLNGGHNGVNGLGSTNGQHYYNRRTGQNGPQQNGRPPYVNGVLNGGPGSIRA